MKLSIHSANARGGRNYSAAGRVEHYNSNLSYSPIIPWGIRLHIMRAGEFFQKLQHSLSDLILQ